MSTKIKVNLGQGFRLKQKGTFDLDKIFKKIREWSTKNKYEFHEKDHVDKLLQDGHEIILKWVLTKETTDYIQYETTIEFLLKGINKIESGQSTGNLQITFKSNLILDYENKWQHTEFLKVLNSIYNKYIIKPKIEKHMGKLSGEIENLKNLTKKELEMYR